MELILTRLHARRKFLRPDLPVFRRPARRRRLGGQRPLAALECWVGAAAGIQHRLQGRRDHSKLRRSARQPAQQRHHGALLARSSSSTPTFRSPTQARAQGQGGAVPGLRMTFTNETTGEKGMVLHLLPRRIPARAAGKAERCRQADYRPERGQDVWSCAGCRGAPHRRRGYVNLIPTIDGGTHVNGCAPASHCGAPVRRISQPPAARGQAPRRCGTGRTTCSIKIPNPVCRPDQGEKLSSREAAALVGPARVPAGAVAQPHPDAERACPVRGRAPEGLGPRRITLSAR